MTETIRNRNVDLPGVRWHVVIGVWPLGGGHRENVEGRCNPASRYGMSDVNTSKPPLLITRSFIVLRVTSCLRPRRSSLTLVVAGTEDWPTRRFGPALAVATVAGVGYTIYSEWLNTGLRVAWSYPE